MLVNKNIKKDCILGKNTILLYIYIQVNIIESFLLTNISDGDMLYISEDDSMYCDR